MQLDWQRIRRALAPFQPASQAGHKPWARVVAFMRRVRLLARSVGTGLAADPRREAVLVGAGVALAYWALRLNLPHVAGAFHDDAVYLALGKAIASGAGYRSIYAVGEPVHLKYPPGLPLIFALLWWIGRSPPAVTSLAAALSVLVSAAASGIVWWIARAKLGVHPWLALVWAIGPFLLDGAQLYFSLPISEPYFVLGWAGVLALGYRLRDRPTAFSGAALGLVLAATVLIRTQAAALLAGLLLALLVERVPWRCLAACAAGALLPLGLWAWYHARLVAAGPGSTQPDEASYVSWLTIHGAGGVLPFLGSAWRLNWDVYWDQLPRYFAGVVGAGVVLLAIFLALAVTGGVLLARRHPALVASAAASAGVVMLWPWPQDRLVFSSLPFAGLLIAGTLQAGLPRVRPRFRGASYAALGILALGIGARQRALRPYAYLPVSPRVALGMPYPGHFLAANTRFVLAVSSWLLGHTTPQDRVLVDAPAAIYLYTGRHTVAARPAQSELVPDLFEPPGRYLASRVVADGVTIVVMTDVGHPVAREVATFYRRCPGVLEYLGNVEWWAGASRAFFYRVRETDGCLRDELLGPATAGR